MIKVALALTMVLVANPAFAQLGALGKIKKEADRVADQSKKLSELNVTEKDERTLGENVSAKIREEFGVFQDAAVTRYVTLVGTVLAQASSRPGLKWQFIVLDTDGVNAFAAPGGIVHITRGALGLIKSEAELAGVLAHEISHITKKHTVNAIRKNNASKLATAELGRDSALMEQLANAAYDNVIENAYDRGDEQDSDQEGLRLANKAGYAPVGLSTFLQKLADRNKGSDTRNALFASHPETRGRIDRIARQATSEKLASSALVEARYTSVITFDAKPIANVVTTSAEGAKGAAGEQPKKKGFGLGSLKLSSGKQAESTQASASAGGRAVGGGADRLAKGGGNAAIVPVTVTPADVATFRKGIV